MNQAPLVMWKMLFMKNVLAFLLLISVCFSCTKTDKYNNCEHYIRGDLSVGIKDGVPIEEVFSLFNRLDVKISKMSIYSYTSPYPQDSLASLVSYLRTKPYFEQGTLSPNGVFLGGVILLSTHFFDMTPANQQDWIATKNALHLTEKPGLTKSVLLKVPEGKEKIWVFKLRPYDMVVWAELNCIGSARPG
jgi:hypothetical protein